MYAYIPTDINEFDNSEFKNLQKFEINRVIEIHDYFLDEIHEKKKKRKYVNKCVNVYKFLNMSVLIYHFLAAV